MTRRRSEWLPVNEGAARVLYRGRLQRAPSGPERVNLFLRDVPEVALTAEVRKEERPLVYPDTAPALPGDAGELRLSRVRLRNFRLLHDAEVDFEASPLTVIVGPNQSGKSTLLDALDLLRMAAQGRLSDALIRKRGGLASVLPRMGAEGPLEMEAEVSAPGDVRMSYRLALSVVGTFDYRIEAESVDVDGNPVLQRQGSRGSFAGNPLSDLNEREPFLATVHAARALNLPGQLAAALSGLAVHPYFRIGAASIDPDGSAARLPQPAQPGARLEATGANLTSALFALSAESDDWELLLEAVRLAFPSFRALHLKAVAKGTIALVWEDDSGAQFDAGELSDGTIQYLALCCALLQRGSAAILIDEPEKHLHPAALHRIMGLAQSVSAQQPVVFSTQSDTLIGMLDESPEAVVVAQREGSSARLFRPNPEELRKWLRDFSLSELRRELETWSPADP